jgi:hypothetical protein
MDIRYIQALKQSIELWKELASDGFLSKRQTKAFQKYNMQKMRGYCPLCNYFEELFPGEYCYKKNCPLVSCGRNSLYYCYMKSYKSHTEKETYAKGILKLLRTALKEAKNEH